MREKDKICHYKALEKLSTQELDTLLQEELRKEKPNEEVVLPILQVLRHRENHCPDGMTENVEKSRIADGWQSAEPKRRWIGKVAAIAAIAIILFFAVPNTVGAESVFDVLIRWTESVFEFLKPGENNDPPVEYVFQTDNPGLQQLYDKVVEMGITEPVVPMWLPEGYELVELKLSHKNQGSNVCAKFSNNNNVVLLTFWSLPQTILVQYEKDNADIEVFETAETQHFIISNDNYYSVIWVHDGVECHINAGLSKNELHRLIDSIYISGG